MTEVARAAARQLVAVLDARRGIYSTLSDGRAGDLGTYLSLPDLPRDDEETLTEPVLADILKLVLGFPPDGYIAQLSRSGLKPDFTPTDLVAHRFVLDAKSSRQVDLARHERQIRTYMDQRGLEHGILFNLREVRVFRRGERGHDRSRSFSVLAVWEHARGMTLSAPEEEKLAEFRALFGYRELNTAQRVREIARAPAWRERGGPRPVVDVDYLVLRLRELSRRLAEDAAVHVDQLTERLEFNPGAQSALVDELRLIALEIQPGTNPDGLPDDVAGFRDGTDLARRAFRQFLQRVAQLALIRILLLRAWEDAGFVAEHLFDGGFGRTYDRVGRQIREVLAEAFGAGRRRYRWLYGEDNNYDWYRPSEDVLTDVLYALLPVPLGQLDADVLGGLYESYIDDIDRDRLGQFYTPRSVVRFMLDRVGYTQRDQLFRLSGDTRDPRPLLDFSTGSGGFLVEAARRIVDDVSADDDVVALSEGLQAIVLALQGSEISPFPYFLTEVNLLLQVSRLLGRMRELGREPPQFVLGVVPADTLATRATPAVSGDGDETDIRGASIEVEASASSALVGRDREKLAAFRRIREGRFDYVVGNPPYVFESGNKVLFDRLRQLPQWKGDYRGKSDYLYYFLLLAAEKLAPDGRMCVITPAGWMNAGNADWLRTRLTGLLRLDELFLFGSYPLFAPDLDHLQAERVPRPPTVESAILVATRATPPPGHRLRIVELRDQAALARAMKADRLESVELLRTMGERADARARSGDGLSVRWLPQADLAGDLPWPIKHGERELASRVVRRLDRQLSGASAVERLDARWRIERGIETAADAYSRRIRKRLEPEAIVEIEGRGASFGTPIMELPPGAENEHPWSAFPAFLARSPEAHALLYGAIDDANYASLVWITREDDVPEEVVDALRPWRALLATRAEIARNAGRRWYETAWARDRAALLGPKVIALYRTDRGRFALDESGAWQPSNKATICTPAERGLSVAYLCGLLNSELLDLWYAVRGKTPWHVRRNYEPKPMARMPYRHVPELAEADPTPGAARLQALLSAGDANGVVSVAMTGGTKDAVVAAQMLELVVRAVAVNRRALLAHRDVAPALVSQVKDPWRTSPVSVDPGAVMAELAEHETRSVRLLAPSITVTAQDDETSGKLRREGDRLVLRHGRRTIAEITGEMDLLAWLQAAVGDAATTPAQLRATRLPADLAAFERELAARTAAIDALVSEGARLVEAAEWLVGRLYGLSDSLIDDVIAHAKERASRTRPSDESLNEA